jgi:acetylornithine deacetylase/succinyl-diaminopimelate desuccinylase family protein
VLGLIDQKKDGVISFLGDYIRFKSINPELMYAHGYSEGEETQDEECQQWVSKQLSVFCDKVDTWQVEKGKPNVVGIVKGDGGGKDLMFYGHSDVVRVTEEQARTWSGPGPWSGEVRNGEVWGRGATDMKGGIAAFIFAAKFMREAGVKLKGDAILATCSAEETAHHEIGPDSVVEKGYGAPLLISAEPSNLQVAVSAQGHFYFRLTVYGRSAHDSLRHLDIYPRPFGEEPRAVNAVEKMLKFMNAYSDLERQWGLYRKHPLLPPGRMTLEPTLIKGGEYKAAAPATCQATYSIYFNPGLTSRDVMNEVSALTERIVEGDYWMKSHRPKLEWPVLEPIFECWETSPDNPGVKTLMQSFREANGNEPGLICSTGVGDENWFARKGKTVVVHGPGGGMQAHGVDERISTDQVIRACRSYACMLINWCGVSEIR